MSDLSTAVHFKDRTTIEDELAEVEALLNNWSARTVLERATLVEQRDTLRAELRMLDKAACDCC